MRINQNIAAFNAYRNLNTTSSQQSKSLEKLSSGFRINRAADDASGLVNSENLRSQIGGLKVATRNAQDAISFVQTAEGAQTEVHSILQRMRDLTVQSGNVGVNDEAALQANQQEISELATELDRIAEQTQFGTKKILNGDFAVAVTETTTTEGGTVGSIEGGTYTAPANNGSYTVDFTVDGQAASGTIAGSSTLADAVTALNDAYNTAAGTTGVEVWSVNTAGDGLALTGQEAGGTVSVDAANAGTGLTAGSDTGDAGTTTTTTTTTGGAVFQVGANADQTVTVGVGSVVASALGNGVDPADLNGTWGSVAEIDITDGDVAENVSDALKILDDAISTVSSNRAELGAFQNRMESTIRNVGVAVENLSAAESRIRDTDMADEMVNFTRHQIMQQAGTAMLAQANQVPQSVLSLLR